MLKRLFDKDKTFKPKKQYKKGTTRYNLHKFAKAFLESGDLRRAIALPPNTDLNCWLSVATVDFYNITNVLYGSITEFCTEATCKVMSSGPKFEYLWREEGKRKAIKVSAPQYVELLMNWIEALISDESQFPTEDDAPFPKEFQEIVKNVFRRLFRVYAHIYYSHFTMIRQLGEECHLNTAFKHFYLFCFEYDLISPAEVAPLKGLIVNMMGEGYLEKK
jgi:MOB kinase activator 1